MAAAVSVNGRHVGVCVVGAEKRPDVVEALAKPALLATGWSLKADIRDVPEGEAEVTVTIWGDPRGGLVQLPPVPIRVTAEPVDVVEHGFCGAVDRPLEGEAVERGVVRVYGWVSTDLAAVSRVEVLVNGKQFGSARLGLERPDVGQSLGFPYALISGFECLVDLNELPASETRARIAIVACTSLAPPRVVLERSVALKEPELPPGPTARNDLVDSRRDVLLAGVRGTPKCGLNLVAFTHDLGYGGGQLWLLELLAQAGAGRDFPCTVVSPKPGPLIADFERIGIEAHVTQDYAVWNVESYEGRLTELALWLTARGHNVALVNTFISFSGADAAGQAGIPSVWAIHESWRPSVIWTAAYPPGYVDPAVRLRVERALYASEAVVFEADATRCQYLDATGPGRAIVVPYGIDTGGVERFRASTSRSDARRALGLPDACRVLLVMGTTEPRKAQTLIAEAFAEVAFAYSDALMVFVGDNGTQYAESLKEYIARAGIEAQTRVIPVVQDTYQWYRAADILVCASDVESLPRSVLEAMCFGLPVLATAVFGLPELISDAQTGFLFEQCDLVAASQALRRVLDLDPESLAAVAEAGRQLVLDQYRSNAHAADMLALLEGLRLNPRALPSEVLTRAGRRLRPNGLDVSSRTEFG